MTPTQLLPTIIEWTSDRFLFPALQAVLIGLALLVGLIEVWCRLRSGRGSVTLHVTRGEQSMRTFYGAYAAATALVVALCIDVEVAKNHRVLWVGVDALLIAYVCVLNGWSQNKILEWTNSLPKLEAR